MAAFTATALALGGMAAFGAIQTWRAAKKNKAPTLAPAPVTPLAPPTPPTNAPGEVNAAAVIAGTKQRKKAAQGSLLTHPKAPISNVAPGVAKTTRRSLIGGY